MHISMGAGSKTDIGMIAPVLKVVAAHHRLPIRFESGPIGNLVLLETMRSEIFLRPIIHISGQIGIGQGKQAAIDHMLEGGAVLNGEGIEGEVLGLEAESQLQGVLPGGQGLMRKGKDEIEVDIFKSSQAGLFDGLDGVRERVFTLEQAQFLRAGGLHAHAEAIEPQLFKAVEIGLVYGTGIEFEGDLGLANQVEMVFYRLNDGLQNGNREEGGGAAAEENGMDGEMVSCCRTKGFNFSLKGLTVDWDKVFEAGIGIEIAVAAAVTAEGNVEI